MPRTLNLSLAALLAGVLAACSAAATSSPGTPSGAASPRVIGVTMTEGRRFEPDSIELSRGETVRFEVRNAGAIRHEFFIGDEDAQADHEAEMVQMGGMAHDDVNGISVEPGETKLLEHTFDDADGVLIGCHVTGHYAAGMTATVSMGD